MKTELKEYYDDNYYYDDFKITPDFDKLLIVVSHTISFLPLFKNGKLRHNQYPVKEFEYKSLDELFDDYKEIILYDNNRRSRPLT
jgi:hypothetical protein